MAEQMRQGVQGQMVLASMTNMVIRIGSAGLLLLLNIQLARQLGPEGFGLLSYTMAWLQILAVIVQFGLPSSLTRSVSLAINEQLPETLRHMLASAFVLMGMLGLAAMAAAAAVWLAFGPPRGGTEVMVAALVLVPVLSFSPVLSGALRGMGLLIWSQIPDQLLRPGLYCLGLFFFGLTVSGDALSVTAALWMQIGTAMIAVLVGAGLLVRALPPATAPLRLRPIAQARIALPFLLLSLAQSLSLHAMILVLGHMVENADLAQFRVALQISDALNMLLFGISVVIGPRIVQLHAQGDWSGLQRLLVQAHRGGTLLLLGPVLVLIIWGEPILELVFGPAYTAAYEPLRLLLAGRLLYGLIGFSGLALSMTGNARTATWTSLVGLLLTLALLAVLVPLLGLNGAALAVVSGAFIINLLGLILLQRMSGRNMSALGILQNSRDQP